MEYELLGIKGGEPLAPDTKNYQPLAMPKATYILSNLLYDIAYLNLCAMRIPINVNFLKPPIPYFKAVSFSDTLNKDWVEAKLLNSIGIFKLIEYYNLIEKSLFKKQIQKLNGRQRLFYYNENNTFFEIFKPGLIRNQIATVINSVQPESKEKIKQAIESYTNKYIIEFEGGKLQID